MSDYISGIKNIPPTYPVKPTEPGAKDRKSGQRKKPSRRPKDRESGEEQDDNGRSDDRPAIDEYV